MSQLLKDDLLLFRAIFGEIKNAKKKITREIWTFNQLGLRGYANYVRKKDKELISLLRDERKILVFNRNFPGLGGGEKHMAYFCAFFERFFPYHNVYLLVENSSTDHVFSKTYPTIDTLNNRFNLSLSRTKLVKKPFVDQAFLTRFTMHFDIFLNSTYKSPLIGSAAKNYYNCMFPFTLASDSLMDYSFVKSYNLFITNSKYTEGWCKKYWGSTTPTTCVYPPVFHAEELENRGQGKKKNIVLSVGRFFFGGHSKKQDAMIELWLSHEKEFEGWELHLAGVAQKNKVDVDYIERIKRLASRSKSIFLHFNEPYSSLQELYSQAKIYWHAAGYGVDEDVEPSKVEHFGITTVEAMSYGAVPIVINKGGQIEVVEEGVNGYKWQSDADWLEKTLYVMGDESKRLHLAGNAIKSSLRYTIESFYDECKCVFGVDE